MEESLYLFVVASLLLNITPGNDMLFVASRTLSQGTLAGVISALGVGFGCFLHIAGAVFGLSVIIANSSWLFNAIKFLGAAYLIYLGIKAFISKSDLQNIQQVKSINHAELFKQGFITNALNPKVAIFFLSFLPQFVDPHSPNLKLQLFGLGLWFGIQGTLILIIVSFLLGKARNFLKQSKVFWLAQQKVTGVILVSLGIKIAVSQKQI